MKAYYLTLASLLISFFTLQAQESKISFNEITHDFGQIASQGGPVSVDFIINNNSEEPLFIDEVTASCGCTVPEYTEAPIDPGKSGVITVTYYPSAPGTFNKSVSVKTNLEHAKTLWVKGDVVSQVNEATAKDEYTLTMGYLLAKNNSLEFGEVPNAGIYSAKIDVYNSNNRSVEPKIKKLPSYLSVKVSPEIISPKATGTIEFLLDASKISKIGSLDGSIVIDGIRWDKSIPYHARVIEDFSQWTDDQRAKAPKISIKPTRIDLAEATLQGSNYVVTLKVSNAGQSALQIRAMESDRDGVTFSPKTLTVKPKEIKDIKISVSQSQAAVFDAANIYLYTNDPRSPFKTLPIVNK